MPPLNTGYQPGPGQVSYDYSGSYDEWRERVVADLIRRYTEGRGGKGSDDPELGEPSPEDFGSAANGNAGQYSHATVQYWERFVDKYGATDPFVAENYGPPPSRRATYQTDPNSDAADRDWRTGENAKDRTENARQFDESIKQQEADRAARAAEAAAELASRKEITAMQEEGENKRQSERIAADAAENEKARIFNREESAMERAWREAEAAKDRDLARERETNETTRVQMDITSREKIAAQDNATRIFLAEGDWGVQKWVEEERNRGALERLTLELGMRDKELAQDAVGERNRHHENMVSLVLEVAKYDSELAAQSVNWLKYAAWLNNRGEVVNGMTLAMAFSNVPEESISPQEVAASGLPGANVAAIQSQQQVAPQGGEQQPEVDPATQAAMSGSMSSATPQPQSNVPAQYKGIDLQNENYEDLLNQILGLNPNAAQPGVDNSQQNIQATLDMLNTTGHSEGGQQQQQPGFNLAGVGQFSFDPRGQKQDYRKFSKLLPSQQQMNAAAAQAGGSAIDDYLYKMNKSRPKGGAVGAGSYG